MARPSPATDRVVVILDLLTERAEDGATLSEVARQVGQTPAACVPVLAALVAAGYLVRHPDDRRYRIGPALAAPGRVAASRYPALDVVHASLESLARAVDRPVLAFRRDGAYARLIQFVSVVTRPAPSIRIGDLLPIEAPIGAVFVAWAGAHAIDEWLDDRTAQREVPVALREQLREANKRGFVVELRPPLPLMHELARLLARGQDLRRAERRVAAAEPAAVYLAGRLRPTRRYEVASVSAPVLGRDGDVQLALGVMGFDQPQTGRSLLDIGERARACADDLARSLERPGPR